MDKAPGCKLATKWLVPSKDSGALGVPGCFQLLGGWVSGHISLGKWENTCCLCYYGLFICAPFFSGLGWLMPGPGGSQQAVICPCEEVALLLRGRSRGAQCAPQGSLPSASIPSRLTHIPPSQTSLPVGQLTHRGLGVRIDVPWSCFPFTQYMCPCARLSMVVVGLREQVGAPKWMVVTVWPNSGGTLKDSGKGEILPFAHKVIRKHDIYIYLQYKTTWSKSSTRMLQENSLLCYCSGFVWG